MTPRKNPGAARPADATPARPAVDWLTARIAAFRSRRETAPIRPPRRKKLATARGAWWSSYSSARLAVRSGIPLDAFLRHRLSRRLARLPVPPSALPVAFRIDASGNVVAAPADEPHQPAWLTSYLRAHGTAAVQSEVLLGHAEAARLAARIDAQRRRVEDATRTFEESTRGAELADPGDEAQAEQMGRPAVPRPLGIVLQAFALVLLVGESWPIAIPCLAAGGIDTTHLVAEAQRDPLAVALGSAFAVGASAALFLLAHAALGRTVRASTRRPLAVAAGVLGATAIVALGWASAGVRGGADLPLTGGYARLVLFLAAVAIPFAGAWLVAAGSQLERARAAAAGLARAWDQEHYRVLADVSRKAAALAEEEARLARLEAERAAVVRRTNALQHRAATAERLASDAAAEEAEELAEIVQVVAAALEQDRYEWVRHASSRGVRAPRAELPVAAPVAAPVRPAREVPERNLGLAG